MQVHANRVIGSYTLPVFQSSLFHKFCMKGECYSIMMNCMTLHCNCQCNSYPSYLFFLEPMWITVHVQEDEGVSGLVQQLSTFSTGDTSGPCLTEDVGSRHSPVNNPFGSSAAFHQYPGLTSSPQSTEDHVLPTVASSCPTLHSSPLSHHSSPNNLHFSPGSSVTTALGVPFITENNLSPLYLNSRQPVSLMEPTDVATPMTHPHKDDQSNQS